MGGSGYVGMEASVATGPGLFELNAGDRVLFHVDSIRMSGLSNLPRNAQVRYTLRLSWMQRAQHDPTELDPVVQELALDPSSIPFSAEVEGVLGDGASSLTATIELAASGTGANEVGLTASGAHLWLKRAGSDIYETEEVPAVRDRSVRTTMAFWDPTKVDVRQIARNYDQVTLKYDYDYDVVPALRYYNPSIKVYMYGSAHVTDWRDERGVDQYFSNCPVGFGFVAASHPEWLYTDDAGQFMSSDGREYFTRVANPEYQALWAQNLAQKARRRMFDGVWIDEIASREEVRDGSSLVQPRIDIWEFQAFVHSVAPMLHAAGLEMVQNGATKHLGFGEGQIYFDPFWSPQGLPNYSANTPDTVPDTHFQEWAFLLLHTSSSAYDRNLYDSPYWLQCIYDTDTLRAWNTATGDYQLSQKQKRESQIHVVGVDNQDDPAHGIDGWLQFGFCSYLLGQSEWTSFGYRIDSRPLVSRPPGYPDIDYTVTQELGSPAGDHQPIGGDQYLRYRRYFGANSGELGGLVIVNGHADQSATAVLDADLVDEMDRLIPAGAALALKPHTGRILLNQTGYKYTSIIDSPAQGAVVGVGTLQISGRVLPNRPSLAKPKSVVVTTDNTERKVLVRPDGQWSYTWRRVSLGRHAIYSSAYVRNSDYEPPKAPRMVYAVSAPGLQPLATVADAVAQPDGALIWLTGKIVTAAGGTIPNSIYIQDDYRKAPCARGLRIYYADGEKDLTSVGETISVVGRMATGNGERYVADAVVGPVDTLASAQQPMAMTCSLVGGGDWDYNAATGAGQRGVTGGYGANNIGMLVRTWGRVTSADRSQFVLSDGSARSLRAELPAGVAPPPVGSYVSVDGISSCELTSNSPAALLRVRTQDDIVRR